MAQVPDTRKAKEAKADYPYTDPDYTVRPGEENDVHVLVGRERNLGKVEGRTRIEFQEITQIVDPQMWLQVRKVWGSQGWVFIKMLHMPHEMPVGFEADTEIK